MVSLHSFRLFAIDGFRRSFLKSALTTSLHLSLGRPLGVGTSISRVTIFFVQRLSSHTKYTCYLVLITKKFIWQAGEWTRKIIFALLIKKSRKLLHFCLDFYKNKSLHNWGFILKRAKWQLLDIGQADLLYFNTSIVHSVLFFYIFIFINSPFWCQSSRFKRS